MCALFSPMLVYIRSFWAFSLAPRCCCSSYRFARRFAVFILYGARGALCWYRQSIASSIEQWCEIIRPKWKRNQLPMRNQSILHHWKCGGFYLTLSRTGVNVVFGKRFGNLSQIYESRSVFFFSLSLASFPNGSTKKYIKLNSPIVQTAYNGYLLNVRLNDSVYLNLFMMGSKIGRQNMQKPFERELGMLHSARNKSVAFHI